VLLLIAVVLIVLWLLGWLLFHIASSLIHFLVVIALAFFIWHLIKSRT